MPTSYRVQEDVVWLAKIALTLERPALAVDLLADEAVRTDWFCAQVSFRLGYTARRLHALARAMHGETEQAAQDLIADRERVGALPVDPGVDPLACDLDRSLGEIALLGGDASGAVAILVRLADAEARTGSAMPAHGWTLVRLGQAADRLGDLNRGEACFGKVTALVDAGIDACHPVVLAARYDQAGRRAAIGDTALAGELLAPLVDDPPLAHGRPALGESHPLRRKAHELADRLGITVAAASPPRKTTPVDSDLDL